MAEAKPKEPLLAVMLSLLLPGLGQAYSNKAKRGFVFFVIDIVFGIILFAYFVHPYTRVSIALIVPVIMLVVFGLYILVDSYRCAAEFNASNNLSRNPSKGKRVLIVLGIVFLVVVFNPVPFFTSHYIRKNLVQSFRFPSGSMQPTLLPGDAILVDKGIYKKSEPARGDIVAFVYPRDKRKVFLKRIVGLPDETVEIKEGNILINGRLVTQPVIANLRYSNRGEFARPSQVVTIPKDSYYVLGDNSLSSEDSRYWGFVPRQNLVGKAYKIYYPFRRSGPIR